MVANTTTSQLDLDRYLTDLRPANVESVYYVTKGDLPLACPMPDMTLWNSHPRVYLSVEETGEAMCPYCGAHYVLKDRSESFQIATSRPKEG